MASTDRSGATLRARLQHVAKVTGKPPKELIGPPVPSDLLHIWQMFLELHAGRSHSANGPHPLSWADIKAWNDLLDRRITEWEARLLKRLDAVWLETARMADQEART